MKNKFLLAFVSFTNVAYATGGQATDISSVNELVQEISQEILNPIIQFMFILAVVFFLWGVAEYIQGAESPDARKKGVSHIIYGLVGIFIMMTVYGLMQIMANFWLGI